MTNFNKNKYGILYIQIIEKAKSENRIKLNKDNAEYKYYETHHIIPKKINPKYSNLKECPWNGILLTAREHFICHILLWKFYKKSGTTFEIQQSAKAIHSLNNMGKYNSRIYESHKLGLVCSEHTKTQIGKANKGKTSIIENDKIIRIDSKDYNPEIHNHYNKGRKHSDEVNAKKSCPGKNNGMYGKKHSNETKRKQVESRGDMSGENNGMYGKKHSNETKIKMAEKASKRTGLNNGGALLIEIYDSNDKIRYISEGRFAEMCKENGLSISSFGWSYRNDSEKLYMTSVNHKHKGWYAKKVPFR